MFMMGTVLLKVEREEAEEFQRWPGARSPVLVVPLCARMQTGGQRMRPSQNGLDVNLYQPGFWSKLLRRTSRKGMG